jgi:hypothetical protein
VGQGATRWGKERRGGAMSGATGPNKRGEPAGCGPPPECHKTPRAGTGSTSDQIPEPPGVAPSACVISGAGLRRAQIPPGGVPRKPGYNTGSRASAGHHQAKSGPRLAHTLIQETPPRSKAGKFRIPARAQVGRSAALPALPGVWRSGRARRSGSRPAGPGAPTVSTVDVTTAGSPPSSRFRASIKEKLIAREIKPGQLLLDRRGGGKERCQPPGAETQRGRTSRLWCARVSRDLRGRARLDKRPDS